MSYLEKKVDWLIYDDNNREILQKEYGLIFGTYKDNRASGILNFCVVNGKVSLSETTFQFDMPDGYKYQYVKEDQKALYKIGQEVELNVEDIDDDDYNEFLNREQNLLKGKRKIGEVVCLEDGNTLYSINGKWVIEPLLKLLIK